MGENLPGERLYLVCSCILLGAGLPSICKTILVVWRQRNTHPSQLLWLWILSMDLVMISTFLPIDSFALITDQFPPIWCKAVGFIATFVSIFSSFAFMQVACLFDKCVCMDKRFSRFELWDLAKYGSQMAMVALAYSLVPLLRDNLGLYRNLYCCCKHPEDPATFWPFLIIFGVDWIKQCYHYVHMHTYVRTQLAESLLNQDKILHAQSMVRAVNVRMSVTFVLTWIPMCLSGVLAYVMDGPNYPIQIDVIAALCVKSLPLLNSTYILELSDKEDRIAPFVCPQLPSRLEVASPPADHHILMQQLEAAAQLSVRSVSSDTSGHRPENCDTCSKSKPADSWTWDVGKDAGGKSESLSQEWPPKRSPTLQYR